MIKFSAHTGWIAFLAILALTLVGCSPPPPLPTVAVLPSSTITYTPSQTLTFTPTDTPTPSNTPTTTLTPTLTPTTTLTPSRTFTPSDTPTDTLTPTLIPIDTFTPTDTSTPKPTFTPSKTITPTAAPIIRTFTVNPVNALEGSSVTAQWDVDADKVEIDLLTQNNGLITSSSVTAQGQQTYTLTSSNGATQTFRLTAFKGGNSVVSTVTVNVTCPTPWFFSPAPPNSACPTAQQAGGFTYQSFQNGFAIYIPNNNTVYFLSTSGAVNSFVSTWNVNVPIPTAIPPSGLQDANSGTIGYTWHTSNWSNGQTVQTVMGWATSGPTNYSGVYQVGSTGQIYLRAPTGAVYLLIMNGSSGSWKQYS